MLDYGPKFTEALIVLFQVSYLQNWREKPAFRTRCKQGCCVSSEREREQRSGRGNNLSRIDEYILPIL